MNDLDAEQIKKALEPVFRIYNVRKAVLFGSYAKGVADVKSDIDLYVDSGLKGMKFVGLIESAKKALNGRDIDMLDRTHVENGSEVLDEINKTGVLVYER